MSCKAGEKNVQMLLSVSPHTGLPVDDCSTALNMANTGENSDCLMSPGLASVSSGAECKHCKDISGRYWYWHWLWWPQLFLSCNCCVTCRRWWCSSDYNVYLAPHYLRSGPCQPLPGHPRTSTLPPSGGGTKKIIAPTDWLTDQTQISSSSGLTLTLRRDEGGDLTRQSEEAGRSQSQLLLHDIVWTRVLLSCLADKALKCEL